MTHITINGEQMTVRIEDYLWEGNTAILIDCEDGSPYCHVTTNMVDEDYASNEVFILDNYEDKFIPVPELVSAGIIEPTDRIAYSGFNRYRLYTVTIESKD